MQEFRTLGRLTKQRGYWLSLYELCWKRKQKASNWDRWKNIYPSIRHPWLSAQETRGGISQCCASSSVRPLWLQWREPWRHRLLQVPSQLTIYLGRYQVRHPCRCHQFSHTSHLWKRSQRGMVDPHHWPHKLKIHIFGWKRQMVARKCLCCWSI